MNIIADAKAVLLFARQRVLRRLVKAGMRCPECKSKCFVVNGELVEFIEEIGLTAYYAAMMLAHRADQMGRADSIPPSAWENVGLSGYQAEVFLCQFKDAWPVWECNTCSTTSHAHLTEQAFQNARKAAIVLEQPIT